MDSLSFVCYPSPSSALHHQRKGGRVAEGARLESVLWVTPYEGSNPSLSAIVQISLVPLFSCPSEFRPKSKGGIRTLRRGGLAKRMRLARFGAQDARQSAEGAAPEPSAGSARREGFE